VLVTTPPVEPCWDTDGAQTCHRDFGTGQGQDGGLASKEDVLPAASAFQKLTASGSFVVTFLGNK